MTQRAQSWIKAHTRALHDPKILRLSWAQRGVWWAALLLSKEHSQVPGMLVTDDRPMALADIALALHAPDAAGRRLITQSFHAFVAGDLMTHGADGYEILNWERWQSGTATEGRDAWRDRKRKQRDKQSRARAADLRANASRAGRTNVVQLRPEEGPP